ncbi:MAG: hypothetical protein HY327_05505 [Chloroflexi bacterium]|nr:hypothetical protein [Chloroflexota bacterium]
MPEIEIFEDKSILVGKRRKGRDDTIEDAMKTMERFADWLGDARDAARNPWLETDAMNTAMLYGMLEHLRDEIDRLIAFGGDEARATYELFKGMRKKADGE